MSAAITGCGVVSPAGAGLDALATALRAGTPGNAELIAGDVGRFPPLPVRTVAPTLHPGDFVGKKGTRRLDRMVGLGLIATHLALESAGRAKGADGERPLSTGVALGTSTGSVRSVQELADAAFTPGRAYVPSRFPNSVMNSCAGQLAVWYGYKAVNATLAGGHASSAAALRYGHNALRRGQAASMLVGGVEELCPQLAWGWARSGSLAPGAVLGEGAAVLVVESGEVGPSGIGSAPVLARLLASEVGFAARGGAVSPAARLATLISRALARTGTDPREIGVVSWGAGSQLGVRKTERDGVERALAGCVPASIRVSDVVGDTFSAAGAMQAAAVLARWSGGAHPEETHALVPSVGADGNMSCLLLARG